MFQKELASTEQNHQKNVCFVIVGILKNVGFKFEPHVYNKCHDVLRNAYELRNIAMIKVKGVEFSGILWGISRDD